MSGTVRNSLSATGINRAHPGLAGGTRGSIIMSEADELREKAALFRRLADSATDLGRAHLLRGVAKAYLHWAECVEDDKPVPATMSGRSTERQPLQQQQPQERQDR